MPWVDLQFVIVGLFGHLLFNAEEIHHLKLPMVSASKHYVNNLLPVNSSNSSYNSLYTRFHARVLI